MSDENKKEQNNKKERRFSQAQYDMLTRCSEKKDMAEWNTWRKENPFKKILLEGAKLYRAHLKGAKLIGAHLEGVTLREAHLEGADLSFAHLEGADLNEALLKGADFNYAHLEGADLNEAYLVCADFMQAHLENANLEEAYLEGADLRDAHLEGADFHSVSLEGANFVDAFVDNTTTFHGCDINRETDFRDVSLDTIRIGQGTKQLLEYNGRRRNWQDWYKGKSDYKCIRWIRILLTSPVRLFWSISNYGLSTLRVILTFFALAFIFAGIYWLFPACIMVNGNVGDLRGFLHAVYFSVVTMTTLGFGDIAANPDSGWGQVLLMLQVLLGYVLLAALVTRFAVLFTAGGPAGKFSKQPKKPTEKPTETPTEKPTETPPN